jgi:hypothetical protein
MRIILPVVARQEHSSTATRGPWRSWNSVEQFLVNRGSNTSVGVADTLVEV